MKKTFTKHIGQCAKGRVRVQIVNARSRKVVRDFGWQNNLILNQGLDLVAANVWSECFKVAVAGTGTQSTQDDSGVTTASQTGTTVTLSGGSFTFTNTGTDGGNYLKWDSGQIARIVTVSSGTECTVDRSQSVGAGEFTYFRANQTGLQTETKRTNTYLTGAGNCGYDSTDYATGLFKLRRTFDFSTESGAITYNEVGFSNVMTVGSNLFSRVKLASGVTLASGELMRVIYELQLTMTPYSPRAVSPTITGWTGTDGDEMTYIFGLGAPDTSGITYGPNSYATNEPASSAFIVMSQRTTALPATITPTGAPNIYQSGDVRKVATLSSYSNGAFTRNKSVTFLASEGNLNDIRSIYTAYYDFALANNLNYVGFIVLLDNPQTKVNTTELTLNFKFTWDRVLA